MSAPPPARQHTVSQVVLRRFVSRSSTSRERGKLAVFDRKSGHVLLKSPKTVFVMTNFVEHESTRLEQLWGRVESRLPVALDVLQARAWPLTAEVEQLLRDVIVLHWTRSAAVRAVHDRIAAEQVTLSKAKTITMEDGWNEAFRRETGGLEPGGAESRRLIQERIYNRLAGPVTAEVFSHKQEEYLDRAGEHFARYRVQIGLAPSGSLLLGDAPVITPSRKIGGFGPHQGVALMDADDAYMPILPNTIVTLGPEPARVDLTPQEVRGLNDMQRHSFIRWLACVPGSVAQGSLSPLQRDSGTPP